MGVKIGTRLNATKSTKGYDIRARSGVCHRRLQEIDNMFQQGVNPLRVTLCASGGSYRLTYIDVARYFEFIGKPYALATSYFVFREDGQRVKRTKLS